MKINQIRQGTTENAARLAQGQAVHNEVTSVSFAQALTQMNEAHYQAYFEGLVADVIKQGELLSKRADIREFIRYREMIRALVNEAVSNGFAFHKFRKYDARGRAKTFALIEKINAKLEEIMNGLLEGEANHIQMLRNIDDIRGLLVDLLM